MDNQLAKPRRRRLLAVPKNKQHLPLRIVIGAVFWGVGSTMKEAKDDYRAKSGVEPGTYHTYWAASADATVTRNGNLIAREGHRILFSK